MQMQTGFRRALAVADSTSVTGVLSTLKGDVLHEVTSEQQK